MTGLHALHVTVGLTVLGVMLVGIMRGKLGAANAHRLELGAIYWHLVDVIWIFLWPLFYLA
jgi:cytochrome c oxidase subunit 3